MLASLAAISPDRTKMTSDDRILALEITDGKKANDSLVDKDNNLHAVLLQNNLWTLKYEHGFLPGPLRNQSFTNFNALLRFVKEYIERRGMKIKEIIDVWP